MDLVVAKCQMLQLGLKNETNDIDDIDDKTGGERLGGVISWGLAPLTAGQLAQSFELFLIIDRFLKMCGQISIR